MELNESINVSDIDKKTRKISGKWYVLDYKDLENIPDIFRQDFKERNQALINLSPKNTQFLDYFYKYFYIDDPDICTDFIQKRIDKYIFKLGDFIARGKVGDAFAVYLKNNVSNPYLVLKSIRNSQPRKFLPIKIYPFYKNLDLMNLSTNYYKFFDQKNNRIVLSVQCNNFETQTCLHLILDNILNNNPYYLRQWDAFYCNDQGWNITEFSNAGTLHSFLSGYENINDEILFTVLKQILEPLVILKQDRYCFSHSDLKAKNIFVTKSNNKFYCKIADFDKSSITWNGFRFYNSSFDYTSGQIPQFPIINDYYQLSGPIIQKVPKLLQLYTMHNPYGFFTTFDIYTMIISLFAIKPIFNFFILNPDSNFVKNVKMLFFQEDWKNIWENISLKQNSLDQMNVILTVFTETNCKLKYSLNDFYKIFGFDMSEINSKLDTTIQNIYISTNNNICQNTCFNHNNSYYKWCLSNNNTRLNTLYHWDYCN